MVFVIMGEVSKTVGYWLLTQREQMLVNFSDKICLQTEEDSVDKVIETVDL